MKIELDQAALSSAIAERVGQALRDGVDSWELKQATHDAVKSSLLDANLPSMLREAATAAVIEDAPALIADVVNDMRPALASAMSALIEESCAAMMYGLLGGKPAGYLGVEETERWNEARRLVSAVDGKAVGGDE